MEVTGSCRQGDHLACIDTVWPPYAAANRKCSCRCHSQRALHPEIKPVIRDVRVRSRTKNWSQNSGGWAVNVFPKPPRVYIDEAMACEWRPPTKEELWTRLQNGE